MEDYLCGALFLYYFLLKNFYFLPFEQYYYIIGTKTQCFFVYFSYICIVYVNEVCQ